ncbi:phosphonate C-P lyase system protein PhnH [Schauerella aestuarii]|uniref:phosphonate C-P lyase system protein PhnH n=1 Tax=Schauerella aestuarii TaxID=2511204 RepID=UPI002E2E0D3F|nr:phosphonate C-P lyase system protein PhnH [Achromobacter aestuarii]
MTMTHHADRVHMHPETPARTSRAGVAILPGFDDPVTQAQTTFRAALSALSAPGTVQNAAAPRAWPNAFSPAMSALLLTLADSDTPVWLPPGLSEQALQYLRFHCGCPLVADPAHSRFVVVPAGYAAPELAACDPGDPAYPDRSSTVLIEVEDLQSGAPVCLTGPGILHTRTVAFAGVPRLFWPAWQRNHDRFPLGVDVLFVHDTQFAALPRTTHAEEI